MFRERQRYFYQAVILLLDHGPEGSYGIILNRPTQYKVSENGVRFLQKADSPGARLATDTRPLNSCAVPVVSAVRCLAEFDTCARGACGDVVVLI